ncbi:Carbohydrate sulfotransferase 14 [Porphyridium purpureum]|uniref:Carbohydrate sulfotransferase 14 n=1 Tax=Porphyridium purpureum TaxID=35688 RepID=A0A5J4YS26_PORPP|nr:Carbohydrate sulfotransferase 14 [Porphyridium purpureum]|eukprot:POR1779..scf229_5
MVRVGAWIAPRWALLVGVVLVLSALLASQCSARPYPHVNRVKLEKMHPTQVRPLGTGNPRNNGFQMYSKMRKYYACVYPKAGCTSWTYYLRYMHQGESAPRKNWTKHDDEQHDLFFFRGNRMKETRAFMMSKSDEYFGFAVVRHPWFRLVSAFRSKYEDVCAYSRDCFKTMWKLPPLGQRSGRVTFHEFVQVVHKLAKKDVMLLNEHFLPAYLQCDFDQLSYDFIADLENVTETRYIAKRIGFPVMFDELTIPDGTSIERMHEVFLCNETTVQLAQEVYKKDTYLLEYKWDEPIQACRDYAPSTDTQVSKHSVASELYRLTLHRVQSSRVWEFLQRCIRQCPHISAGNMLFSQAPCFFFALRPGSVISRAEQTHCVLKKVKADNSSRCLRHRIPLIR